MSEEKPKEEKKIEKVIEPVLTAIDRAPEVTLKDVEEASKKLEEKERIRESCVPIRVVYVCIGDFVTIKTSRITVQGEVIAVHRQGIAVKNQNRKVVIPMGKIMLLFVEKEGEIHKKLEKLEGDIYRYEG